MDVIEQQALAHAEEFLLAEVLWVRAEVQGRYFLSKWRGRVGDLFLRASMLWG